MVERDVRVADGRVVHAYDSGAVGAADLLTIVWHHGSPQTGALFEPLLSAAAQRRIRLLSYGRPSYGGSSPRPGRDVASAADDVARVAGAFGVERFAVMGSSGGGPHALACAALLPRRVTAAVCLAGLAPFAQDVDWFAGMHSQDALRAATLGRGARARYAESETFDPASFTDADRDAIARTWSALAEDAGRAAHAGPDGLIDDDIAFVTPWGFDPATISSPVLLVHGRQDRVVPHAHSEWLARVIPRAQMWSRPRDGHVSVLDACPDAMDWLLARAGRER